MADDSFSIHVKGIDECCAQLDAMPKRMAKNAIARALVASALPIMEALNGSTPVRTGLLKESMVSDVQVSAEGKGGVLTIGFSDKEGFIARMLEFGHRKIGHKPKKTDKGKVKDGKPFMRPAAAKAADASVEAFETSMAESFEEGI